MVSNPRVRANFVALDGKGLFLFSTRLIAEDNEKEKEGHRPTPQNVRRRRS
jgi:hypothetical protein